MDVRREARALGEGCHVVVGTPGRLRDHLERGRLDPSHLRAVVLDEADEMLDLGFREDLEFILDSAPAERRTLLFSATIARDIAVLAQRFQRHALRIDTVDKSQPHGDIEYKAVRVAPSEIEHAIVNVLRFFEPPGALVFCHTREAVKKLYGSLLERGFAAVALSGEMGQGERNHALQALRDGRARVCVATDVAARGIDLPGLDLVIHAELPRGRDALLHRSGRTGRAGRKGVCVLITPFNRRRRMELMLQQAGLDAEWIGPPSAQDVRRRDQQRLMEDPIFSEDRSEEDMATARLLMEHRTAEEIAGAFVRAVRSRLPEPEDVYDAGPQREREPRDAGRPVRARDDAAPRSAYDPAKAERTASGPMVWFRMSIGRQQNADPRWLLPVICRRGHVTKKDIGAIRIFDRETKFEISEDAADRFAQAALARGGKGGKGEDIRFDHSEAPAGDRPTAALRHKRPPPHLRDVPRGGSTSDAPGPAVKAGTTRSAGGSASEASHGEGRKHKAVFKPKHGQDPAALTGERRSEGQKPARGFKKAEQSRAGGPKRAHRTKPRRG
jgi:ATP-dependent RNA helicase DeaD